MKKIKVSVIIPAYNAEKTIKRCIDSVLSQTYDNIEIIIVNDGSTDNTLPICLEYQEKNGNITLLNHENSGVSKSRNRTLNKLSGEYIQFLDSDDVLYENTIADKVEKICKYNADLVITEFDFINSNGKKQKSLDMLKEDVINIEQYAHMFSKHPTSLFYGVLWNKLFRSEIIYNNGLRFEDSKSFAEDFRFILEYLKYVDKIAYIPKSEYGYSYDSTQESLSKNKNLYNKIWDERKQLYSKYLEFFKYKEIDSDNLQDYLLESLGGIFEIYIRNNTFSSVLHMIHDLSKDDEISKIIKQYKGSKITFKVLLLCIKYKMTFIIYLLYRIHICLDIKG